MVFTRENPVVFILWVIGFLLTIIGVSISIALAVYKCVLGAREAAYQKMVQREKAAAYSMQNQLSA